MMTTNLDCGHVSDWEPGFGPARDAIDDSSRCKRCAHAAELAGLRAHDRFFGYLSADQRDVTSWPGERLAHVLPGTLNKHQTYTQAGYAHPLWTFRARDVHGQVWACRHWPDAGDYVRMRRIRPKRTAVQRCQDDLVAAERKRLDTATWGK